MFLLWKNILWIPIAFLVSIGTPFKWDNDGSSLKNISEHKIRESYSKAKMDHYFGRIMSSAVFIIGCLIFLLAIWATNGFILLVFPVITLIVLLIDGFMAFCRYVYFCEEEKKAEQRQELVVIDCWKDTSLTGILRQRTAARKAFRDEFFARTQREPKDYDYSNS